MCEHDFAIGLDNLIKCRLCGQIGGESMEVLATVQSKVQARRIQDEIVKNGGWKVSGGNQFSVIYARKKGDSTEELSIERRGVRQWEVHKTVKSE